jgi:arylsulfatase A-like enzyme
MPRLAEIARSGTRYLQAVSPSPWTLPSAVSLLSAMNPFRHRVGRMRGAMPVPGDPAAAWLGPALRDAGYQVAGFVNNPWLRPYYGLGRGYMRFRRYHGRAADGVDVALDWIASHRARPSFVFLHLMDPHWPYGAPEGHGEPSRSCAECDGGLRVLQYLPTTDETRAEIRRRYDAECAYTDGEIGRLWDALAADGLLDDTWLIVTSDHGEEFWEHHRFLHGHSLYDELLRVPLVVVPPRAATVARGLQSPFQVRLEDVAATIAALTGVARPQVVLDGSTLFAPAMGAHAGRPVVAGFLQQEAAGDWAVRTSAAKLVRFGDSPVPILYDLVADPRETTNVVLSRPLEAVRLDATPSALGLSVAPPPPLPAGAAPDAEADIERELRTLGYVD